MHASLVTWFNHREEVPSLLVVLIGLVCVPSPRPPPPSPETRQAAGEAPREDAEEAEGHLAEGEEGRHGGRRRIVQVCTAREFLLLFFFFLVFVWRRGEIEENPDGLACFLEATNI
jgi:hypothetical protein